DVLVAARGARLRPGSGFEQRSPQAGNCGLGRGWRIRQGATGHRLGAHGRQGGHRGQGRRKGIEQVHGTVSAAGPDSRKRTGAPAPSSTAGQPESLPQPPGEAAKGGAPGYAVSTRPSRLPASTNAPSATA